MTEARLTRPEFTQEAFEAFLSSRLEPRWLTDLRRNAWKAFQDLPCRTTSRRDRSRKNGGGPTSAASASSKFALPDEAGTRRRSGRSGHQAVCPPPRPLLTAGVDLAGRGSCRGQPALPRPTGPGLGRAGRALRQPRRAGASSTARGSSRYLFTRAVDPLYDKFSALHAACWSGGMMLYVPKGVVIDRPLHMFSALSAGQSDFGHALIVLEEGAEATLLAETASSDPTAAGLHCGAVEILVGPGARLRYVNLQNWGSGVWHFAHHKALVGRDASLQWTIGALGSRLAKVNQHVALVGEGAHAQVNGVMFTDGTQHLSYHTLQHHEAPHCTSDLLYKGALQGESRIVWRGMIKVDRDAQKTDGYQRDDNLILSESARADSIPGPGDRGRRREVLARGHGRTRGRRAGVLCPGPRPDPQGGDPHDRGRLLPAGLRSDHGGKRPRGVGRGDRAKGAGI